MLKLIIIIIVIMNIIIIIKLFIFIPSSVGVCLKLRMSSGAESVGSISSDKSF